MGRGGDCSLVVDSFDIDCFEKHPTAARILNNRGVSRSKRDNESSCGIVSEGASADEKQGIYFDWPKSVIPFRSRILLH